MERVYDKITADIPREFQNKNLAKPLAHSQLKSFLRSGDKQYQPFASTGFKKVGSPSIRESKLGNNVCVLQPQHVLGELHKKSYFKAATGFMLGQEKSLEHKHTEKMVEAFASISQNIQKKTDELGRTRRNIKGSAGGYLSAFMLSQRGENQSPTSKGRKTEKQGSPLVLPKT